MTSNSINIFLKIVITKTYSLYRLNINQMKN